MRSAILRAGLAVALLAGCSPKQPQRSASEYFESATSDYRSGGFARAIEQYRELIDQHPFSDVADEAELRIAHAYFLTEDYTAAIIALTDFQRRHPTSEHLPLVGYLLGMCYVRQMTGVDRDQTSAQSAHTYFTTLIHQYPESPFADLAREELKDCRESLAEHELQIAAFYSKRGNEDAAEVRLLSLTSKFGETPTAADALLQLARTYARNGNSEHAVLAIRALEALHPDSEEAREARTLVSAEAAAAVPPTTDPLDLLMIAHGREREGAEFGIPKVPTASERTGRSPFGGGGSPTGPAAPRTDPFGRGSTF
jgi:outer membrane protein assembly factor BamD